MAASLKHRVRSFATAAVRYRLAAAPAAIAALLLSASTVFALDPKLESSLSNYREKYPLQNSTDKLIDDSDAVPSTTTVVDPKSLAKDLKGVKNFRYVLNGLLYRGGKISPSDTRWDNRNPMSNEGLINLCKQGFGKAIYLYDKNLPVILDKRGRKKTVREWEVKCKTIENEDNTLVYRTLPPLGQPENVKTILGGIKDALARADYRPTYVHCWNGWHASGYISALALRQFCGFSIDDAINYWNVNTDHVCKGPGGVRTAGVGYKPVRQQIRTFPGIDGNPGISEELQKAVCPQKPPQVDQESYCDRL